MINVDKYRFEGGEVFTAENEQGRQLYVACQPEFDGDIWSNLVMQTAINLTGNVGPYRIRRDKYKIEILSTIGEKNGRS